MRIQRILPEGERWTVVTADALGHLATLPPSSVDAVVCDPPYGIDIDGRDWDGRDLRTRGRSASAEVLTDNQAFGRWTSLWGAHCLRALKPGGHLVAFGAPRTWHRLATGLEDAGFEPRDTLAWLFGQGLIKSARLADGQRTSVKPAHEPVALMRRPLSEPTVARNIEAHGTGGLNIEDCRVPDPAHTGPRLPANVLLAHTRRCRPGRCESSCPARHLDEQSGTRASRFFYCAKATRHERDAGCEDLAPRRSDLFPDRRSSGRPGPLVHNHHPTVKPLAVMRWLIRLVAPHNGLVLDPFCGSGSTGCAALLEGRRFLGIERDEQYARLARTRITHWGTAPCPEGGRHHPRPTRPRPFA